MQKAPQIQAVKAPVPPQSNAETHTEVATLHGTAPAKNTRSWLFPAGVVVFLCVVLGLVGYLVYSSVPTSRNQADQEQERAILPDDSTQSWEGSADSNELTDQLGSDEQELETFADPDYPFTFQYPADVEVEAREYEDLGVTIVTVQKIGPTQQDATEFYDGLSLSFTVRDLTGQTLDAYVDQQMEQSKEVGEILQGKEATTFNSLPALRYTTQGLGIFENLYIQQGDEVIKILNMTQDPTNQGFQEEAELILESFTFVGGM